MPSAVPCNATLLLDAAALAAADVAMLGAGGGVVSIVTLNALDATLVLPEESVTCAVKACLPSLRAAVVKLQLPLEFAVAVPICLPPSNTLTVPLAAG